MSDDKADGQPTEEENPWDEDDGMRTVATGAPVDLPSNIPSPITAPPPAMPAPPPAAAVPKLGAPPAGKKAGKQTMIGIAGPAPGAQAPPDFSASAKPLPAAGRPAVAAPPPRGPGPAIPQKGAPLPPPRTAGGPPPSFGRPAPPSSSTSVMDNAPPRPRSASYHDDEGDRQEDGPTMAVPPESIGAQAVAAMREEAKRTSPLASTGFASSPMKSSKAEPGIPDVSGDEDGADEEATRAVARENLMRSQDAHVVVGEDAIGDEATLAVGPGELADLRASVTGAAAASPRGASPIPPAAPSSGRAPGMISAAIAESLSSSSQEPAFPAPPNQPGSAPHVPAASQQASGATAAMPSFRGFGGPPPAYDPMMPGSPPGFGGAPPGYPPSLGPNPPPQPMSFQGPSPNAATAAMPGPPVAPPPAMGPPPWMSPPTPPPQGMANGFKLTPQIITLAVVGVFCLAIFVVGVVLFVQTKFN